MVSGVVFRVFTVGGVFVLNYSVSGGAIRTVCVCVLWGVTCVWCYGVEMYAV